MLLKDPIRHKRYDFSSDFTFIETTSLAIKKQKFGIEVLFSLMNTMSDKGESEMRYAKDLLGLIVGYFDDEHNYFLEFKSASIPVSLKTYNTGSDNQIGDEEYDSKLIIWLQKDYLKVSQSTKQILECCSMGLFSSSI